MFGRDCHPTPLGQGFAEYGRIAETLHLLAIADPVDDSYQRRMNRQLTVQESRHALARAICHGNRGQIRQAYQEGQQDQLAALGLVLKAVVLRNTRYLDGILTELRWDRPPGERAPPGLWGGGADGDSSRSRHRTADRGLAKSMPR